MSGWSDGISCRSVSDFLLTPIAGLSFDELELLWPVQGQQAGRWEHLEHLEHDFYSPHPPFAMERTPANRGQSRVEAAEPGFGRQG